MNRNSGISCRSQVSKLIGSDCANDPNTRALVINRCMLKLSKDKCLTVEDIKRFENEAYGYQKWLIMPLDCVIGIDLRNRESK